MSTQSISAEAGPGYVGRIPVRNLWLLMLYASDLFRMRGTGDVGLEENPDELPDLVAEILARAVEVRQRHRLSLGYRQSRPQESEQDDKWSFCLTAGTLCPANQERQ